MTHERIKTERAGAKEGAGRKRRQAEEVAKGGRTVDEWGDLDQFSAHASCGVLRHMTEDEEAAGFSWDELRPE
jgi:hypothetical protein